MAKKRPPESKAKQNPLGAIARKPSSYVGDLDSLLAEVGERLRAGLGQSERKAKGGAGVGGERAERR